MRKASFKDRDEIALSEMVEAVNEGMPIETLFSRQQAIDELTSLGAVDNPVIMFDGTTIVRYRLLCFLCVFWLLNCFFLRHQFTI